MLGKPEKLKFTKRVKPLNERDRKQAKRKKDANRRRAGSRARYEAFSHWLSYVKDSPNNKTPAI